MDPLLQATQHDLSGRLAQLTRAIQQVATEPPPGNASDPATAEAARQDAALRQALQEAAARIRDFQRQAEHEAQAYDLDQAAAPERARHAQERAQWQQQLAAAEAELAALRQRVVELNGARSAAFADGAAWQHLATSAQSALENAERQHTVTAGALHHQLARAQAQEAAIAAQLEEAAQAAAAETASLHQELAEQQARAERVEGELTAAIAAWQEERTLLAGGQQAQSEEWATEREQLRAQLADAGQRAATQAARADTADQRAAGLQCEVQLLTGELGAAQQALTTMQLALSVAKVQGADLGTDRKSVV